MKIILLQILLIPVFIYGERPDTTLRKIESNRDLIIGASRIFDISPRILASIIYTERTLNYTWEDRALDKILAEAGVNSSIGFSQIKLKTAYWIEVQLNEKSSKFFPGKKYKGKLKLSASPGEIIKKLDNDSLNIMYAAAYLRIIKSRWVRAGCPISGRAEILGTLYSTGIFKRDGSERKPNKNPKANEFGEKVREAFGLFGGFNNVN